MPSPELILSFSSGKLRDKRLAGPGAIHYGYAKVPQNTLSKNDLLPYYISRQKVCFPYMVCTFIANSVLKRKQMCLITLLLR